MYNKFHSLRNGALAVITIALFSACGGSSNNQSATNQSSSEDVSELSSSVRQEDVQHSQQQADETDAQMQSHKKWEYAETRQKDGVKAMNVSENFYKTDKGENVYCEMDLIRSTDSTPYYYASVNMLVMGTPTGQAGTVVRFTERETNVLVSFDDGRYSSWYGSPVGDYLSFSFTDASDMVRRLHSSSRCSVEINTDMGSMRFHFNTKDLHPEY